MKEHRDNIHENEIGSAVFERAAAYDTTVDPIVRVNATELRKSIHTYFNSEGLHETLIMEIPRGSYIPVFRNRSAEPQIVADTTLEIPTPIFRSPEAIPKAPRSSDHPGWMLAAMILAGVIVIVLTLGRVFVWSRYRALDRQYTAYPNLH